MASTRVINYISYKRFAAASSLRNVSVLSNFNIKCNFRQNAFYCTRKSIAKADTLEHENKMQVTFADVVKENTKSAGYLGVIIGGVGVTAFMFYMIFDELFSSKSPNNVYSKALDVCIKNQKVRDSLGEPIKAYGEESRRGRRSHIRHITFMKDNVRHMRMKFYIQGIRRRGTVNLEVQEDQSGKYVYRYLYVLVDDMVQSVIKIEDNRDPEPDYSDQTEFI
ncbi:mitochondrial import inner membrane translocase subunit Tim21 [Ceratina calcarata]|uniref:Mitochondrial import inner membrane translocase subunit Tim21 n=1 Tax=Ceratina calcarata TaxID=156304 RepID=A0AAJ7N3W4_9HYME|nr:mitochondrial import inner membrane translocase subunit Tim21 [Ceratina calcarata]XP_017876423.1 mitochondrial import inner membrane translocase subunit Tim21 [Ceratina calcarata]XP_017876424.1 mitochondrial import inner membrane translocase subunit Tim21 [Ceratina calcarata]XP_017876425.1 mitochondrial import inner membrane translocase subunit Tim21 [Ceratina calcarata]XP_026667570.1 mitochondrial import inner membrane translocase subunit Tim21 [Ceratina calcarata]